MSAILISQTKPRILTIVIFVVWQVDGFLAYHDHDHHDSSRAADQHPGDIGQLHAWSNQSRFIFILSGYFIRLRGVN